MNDGTTNEQVVDTTDRVETISDLRMVKGTLVQATLNQAIRIAVNNAIEDAKMHFLPPSQDEVTEIEYRILDEVNRWISTVVADDGEKIQRLSYLPNAAIARLMIALEGIKALNYSDGNNAGNYQLGIYQDCGENEGIYVTTEDLFIKVIKNIILIFPCQESGR